ncbi:hypothetical protein [Mesorhizobium sp. WSM3862]|uniref:hypothetical protein n=1 Tax=Mesorhizobium sp. WSM3862 TaxID=632858 RepID=UPI0015969E9F|nr:hypothetical protein [Mesorhizobium sp. WSM3862]
MSESAAPIKRFPSTAAAHGRATRKPMRSTGASIGARRRAAAGRPPGVAHAPGRDATACSEARGVCPILILVNRLPKEHPA